MPIQLSQEQQRVVEHRGSHVQVIACAGSGKTEAISRRVASLIEDGVPPASIIAFTFTEKAAAELKERVVRRVRELMGGEVLDTLGPMFVGTIHGYCFRLLQDHIPRYGNHDVLDEHRVAGLLSREHRRLELSRLGAQHWRPIFDFQRNLSVIENELVDPAALAGTDLGDCYRRWCETLDRYRFLTFGQLVAKAVAALEDPAIHARIHAQLCHLIVDEYQDINPAQERLIRLLARDPVQLCVVGDDDQSIYQWRGSEVDNILTFEDRYEAVQTVSLVTNRRSRPRILTEANAFAETITPRLPKEMLHYRASGGPEVVPWLAETAGDEAEVIAAAVARLRDRGFRYRDVAVLFRSVRTSSGPLLDALDARGIPYSCAGRTGLFLQEEVDVLARTYAWLVDRDWQAARFQEPDAVALDDLVAMYQRVFNDGALIPSLREHLDGWKRWVPDNRRPVSLVGDYYRLLHLLGVHQWDLANPGHAARMGALARFAGSLADYEHVTRRGRPVEEDGKPVYRGGTDRGIYYYQRLHSFLQHYARDAYEEFEGEELGGEDAVQVLTVHQAKGLEWPVVFVPSLTSRRFPSSMSGRVQDWLVPEVVFPRRVRARYEGGDAEERRLFYVAMTRARDAVYLSSFERITRRTKPSPYLVEVAGGDPPRLNQLPLPDGPEDPGDDAEPPLPISFSDVAQYETCPLRFRLSALMGFPPTLATELGYGRAIHHVLQQVAEEVRETGELPTPARVEDVLASSFYVPFANRAAYDRLVTAAHRLVGRYMDEHGEDLLRVWATERSFELHLEGGTIAGRADVILDREGGVEDALAIVDYKTADDSRADDLFSFQLAVYAEAARGEGLNVRAAYLHRLHDGSREDQPVDSDAGRIARRRAEAILSDMRAGQFDPRAEEAKCLRCDARSICGHAACSPLDLH